MKKLMILCFTMIAISCSTINESTDYFSTRKLKVKHSFFEFEDIGIRRTPITNREYMIFLCWNIHIYGLSYPEKIASLFPTNNNELFNLSVIKEKNRKWLDVRDYQSILNNIDDVIFQTYTLNSKYLDYPVVGLSKNQIFEILKWMNNRYNEHLLINKGILNFNSMQRDEDCYVSESYLTGQYQGNTRKNLPDPETGGERAPKWEDLPFLATFRLPYDSELERIQANIEEPFTLKEYEFNKKNFLWIWDDFYSGEKNDQVIYKIPRDVKLQFVDTPLDFDVDKLEVEIGTIDTNCYQNLKYLEQQNKNEKDKYGYRDFLILGEGNLGRAITGDFKDFDNGIKRGNLIAWPVFNKEMRLSKLEK